MKKLIALTMIAALAGCGTIEGFGNDLSTASRAVKRAL